MIPTKPYISTREWYLATHVKDAMEARRWLEKARTYDANPTPGGEQAAALCRQFARSDARRARWALKEWKEAL